MSLYGGLIPRLEHLDLSHVCYGLGDMIRYLSTSKSRTRKPKVVRTRTVSHQEGTVQTLCSAVGKHSTCYAEVGLELVTRDMNSGWLGGIGGARALAAGAT